MAVPPRFKRAVVWTIARVVTPAKKPPITFFATIICLRESPPNCAERSENMKTSAPFKWLNLLSLVYAVCLVIFLPVTYSFRSPGDVSAAWFFYALATGGLIALNWFGLKAFRHHKQSKRLGLYVSTGVAVGVAFLLLNVWP